MKCMFDYKRWTNAAPKLLLIKYSMKKDIASVNSDCPDVKKIDNLSQLDSARAAATGFTKKLTQTQAALAKMKSKDKGAEDLLKLWQKTIKSYISDLVKREKLLIAGVNQKRKDDDAENQQIVDEIKASMEKVAVLYGLARKNAALALQLRQKDEEMKAANHIIKTFKQIKARMLKEGQSAHKNFKVNGKNLTPQQKKTVNVWLKSGGKFAEMATPVNDALDHVMNKSGFPDLKKMFPPPPKI